MSRKAAASVGLARNNTVKFQKKKYAARGSAITTNTFNNMLDESQQPKRRRRRSTLGNRDKKTWDFEDQFNLDDIHVMGSNDILERMKEYVNHEFEKAHKGMSKLRLKRYWKKVRGKQLNEEQEKNRLRQKFILEHLHGEQRKMFEKELLEETLVNDDDSAPKFEMVTHIANKNRGTCRCQILRSSDNWSTGIKQSESSILNAYLELISNAKKFIYIENQFFISNPGKGGIVKNPIAKALKNRILDAHSNNEKFMIIVFIPLMPGFEGDVLKGDSAVLKTQIKYQQETISKGKNSLFTLLENEGVNPSDYIKFYGLRQHALMNNVPKTEIIYIHSKLMIVDDRKVIMGSANINDRSMLGTRDSELAVLIEDENVIESKLGGETFLVGEMPYRFRTEIFMEHYGADTPEEVQDPLSPVFKKRFDERCSTNTKMYRRIFKAEPDNSQTTNKALKKDRADMSEQGEEEFLERYNELSPHIKGHFVEYPTNYMKDVNLGLKMFDKEKIVPAINFV